MCSSTTVSSSLQENPETSPVALWLQGGPGGSSLYGMFVENGPFGVDENMNLVPRNLTWVNRHNMLYIDNPVGTGEVVIMIRHFPGGNRKWRLSALFVNIFL